MFANATHVGISQRVVAMLVASAMVLWTVGVHYTAQAADLIDISNTISDSAPGALPSHTISFEMASTSLAGDNFQVSFDTAGDGGGGQDFGGLAAIVDNSNLTFQVAGGGFAAPTFVASDGDSFTISGIAATAGQVVDIVVAAGVITNPTTVDSYEISVDIANTNGDSGRTRIAIVDTVEVTAQVDTTFDFTITGLATSTSLNGTTTTGSTSPTLIDFGTLAAGVPEILAQRLNVQTNALNGFVVTVETDGDLESTNGAIIDTFIEGGDQATPTNWVSPVPVVSDNTSWGHWGLTTLDSNLDADAGGTFYGSEFATGQYVAASTTPREVFRHTGVADGTTDDVGSTTVAYQIEITALQEAAEDYTTTLTYIATPTF